MKIVTRLLDDLASQMRRTAHAAGIEAVHDLRVSVRRATQALRLFEKDLPPSSRRIRREIKRIRRRAAAVRDKDITQEILRNHQLPVTDPANVCLSEEREVAAAELQKFLRRRLSRRRPRKWADWLGEAE